MSAQPAAVTIQIPPLNDDLREILGRPNFACAAIARVLRKSGVEIRRKAEEEQAAVIHWLLMQYEEHGENWCAKAQEELSRIEAAS